MISIFKYVTKNCHWNLLIAKDVSYYLSKQQTIESIYKKQSKCPYFYLKHNLSILHSPWFQTTILISSK